MNSPIALFVYNRIEYTRRTIDSLRVNHNAKNSDLFVYSDGPKNSADREQVYVVRNFCRNVTGFKSVTIAESDRNHGLANSIINGVTELVNRWGTVIVLEDDMVTSPFFLDYMNESLVRYENSPEVASIHGYIIPRVTGLPDSFFLKGADCWGWATWKRAWHYFEPDGSKLLRQLQEQNRIKEFDFNGKAGFSAMLKGQIEGKNNSWAVRWYASAFLRNMVTLYPGISLVENIGFVGTHARGTPIKSSGLSSRKLVLEKLPAVETATARAAYTTGYRKMKIPMVARVLNRIRRLLK